MARRLPAVDCVILSIELPGADSYKSFHAFVGFYQINVAINFTPLPLYWLRICDLLFRMTLHTIGLIDRLSRDELIVSVKKLKSLNRRQ
jgi:hypothetical protein